MHDLSNCSLRDKIGQIVMCGFDGTTPTDGIRSLIRDYKLGGIIYFRRNVGPGRDVARLSAELRRLAAEVSEVPLLIAIDQEGGMVARIDQDVTVMPGNMALGAAGETSYAYDTARISGTELQEMGINLNFAPCLDVNNNPANPVIGVRSYGERPASVAALGRAAIAGYQDAGVSACAKHFPGHGDTAADSHLELPVVPHDRRRLDEVELVPFREAIAAGVDAIMTAHVLFPAYESGGLPSTLSANIISGLLREELGFDGVILTDCMEMKAISETVGVAKGAVMAVKAGADLVLVSHLFERQKAALDALYSAAQSGEIPEARIEEAVRRVILMKEKRERNGALNGEAKIGSEERVAVARTVSEKSVTLVKNEGAALPLQDVPTLAIWPEVRARTEVQEIIPQEITIGKALSRYLTDVREIRIGTEPSAEEVREALAASNDYKQIVIGTYNASFSTGQTGLVQALLERQDSTVVVAALRNPYDLLVFPDAPVYMACYENRPVMMESLAKVLTGIIPAAGRLPVGLSERYPCSFGLTGRR